MTARPALQVVTLLFLAVTAPASARRAAPLVSADSAELPDGARAARSFVGTVERVAPTSDETGWFEVVVSGSREPAARTFLLYGVTRSSQLPFRVGDALDATIDCSASGFHRACAAVVRRGAEVLLVISPAGASLEGWAHSPGSRTRDAAPSRETSLVLRRDGCPDTETSLGRWRSVTCDDGTYIVSGSARTPLDSSIPDSSAYTWFAVSRSRARRR